MRTIAYIAAGIFIFFGVIFIWGAFGSTSTSGSGSWLSFGIGFSAVGVLFLAGGAALVYAVMRGQKTEVVQQVTMNVDLPGDTKASPMTCRNCGGALKPENVKMVAGAPMVECPYCGTTYQLTEAPKW